MPHTAPSSPQPAMSELHSPAPHADTREAQQSVVQKDESTVGEGRQALNLRCRVERVQRDIEACRTVPDDELRQHARDLTFLMEISYDRFHVGDGDEHRLEAMALMHRRDAALQMVSPQGKAAREAQIQSAIGSAHFMQDGERDRAALASNDAGEPR